VWPPYFHNAVRVHGERLIPRLLGRPHGTRSARPGSEASFHPVCVNLGNALDHTTYVDQVAPADTFVQLVGVAHPVRRRAQFRSIDLVAGREAVVQRSKRASSILSTSAWLTRHGHAGLHRSAQRMRSHDSRQRLKRYPSPWYVLGPAIAGLRSHPFYWLFEKLPPPEGARRLGLITLEQMIRTLVVAVDHPPRCADNGCTEIRSRSSLRNSRQSSVVSLANR